MKKKITRSFSTQDKRCTAEPAEAVELTSSVPSADAGKTPEPRGAIQPLGTGNIPMVRRVLHEDVPVLLRSIANDPHQPPQETSLRRLAELGDLLDPNGVTEYRLELVRRRRGRPRDCARASHERIIYRDLRATHTRHGKLEAAISEVCERHRIGRSTAMRVWSEYRRNATWGDLEAT
jgi:hypothetical protein